MHERCDHNRFAEQLAARLREPDQNSSRLGTWRCKRCGALTYGDYCDSCGDGKRLREPSPIIITASPRSNTTNGSTTTMSSLFQPAEVTSAFIKLGLLGFQGGGKTLTASKVTIGLVNHMRELGIARRHQAGRDVRHRKGSDWLIPDFEKAGASVRRRQDEGVRRTAEGDGRSRGQRLGADHRQHHPSVARARGILPAQERALVPGDGRLGLPQGRARLAAVHRPLRQFQAAHRDGGRAGFEYENYVEDGRKKMEKVGTKMKTEGETGYEPSTCWC
jgi:hypothetical protein